MAQPQAAYPPQWCPPVRDWSPPRAYVAPPPPGNPGSEYAQASRATADRGFTREKRRRKEKDGFWAGCCAAICCCSVLDACDVCCCHMG
ncbi:hypothetical protein C5167_017867 [Papaver somniferum]|uniref:Cysteine-rich transmembrane domain-containing protein n=1 Tax=Papaver somniferum TaxID=3469 RepID=A0A4Y7IPP0_PAPSO|nr:cysteine-rich and transmembrane domain-containing protein WIH1-like [Papaver somniferum]RZC49435.1 hypothetical protein C5167_017867 [Papaver somniferum]